MRTIDFLIVGLGLAGSALALQLRRKGHEVMVLDQPVENQASRVAAGLFNPVTGKLMTRTWNADKIFPALHEFYQEAERTTGKKFFHEMPICIPFRTVEEQNNFMTRSGDRFIAEVYTTKKFNDFIFDHLGGVLLRDSGYVDTNSYLDAVKDYLVASQSYEPHLFNHAELMIHADHVSYSRWRAKAIIFCEGTRSLENPLFNWVPVRQLKGETLELRLNRQTPVIFNRGVYVVPVGNRGDGYHWFRVGATYDHNIVPGVTQAAKHELEKSIHELLRTNFRIGHQDWGIRPTSPDRRPILGQHPEFKNVVIFNGLGTKGVSLAPYFAGQLSEALSGLGQIDREVNITRFYALYSKF